MANDVGSLGAVADHRINYIGTNLSSMDCRIRILQTPVSVKGKTQVRRLTEFKMGEPTMALFFIVEQSKAISDRKKYNVFNEYIIF